MSQAAGTNSDLLRQEIAALATTVVVKVGTRVLTHQSGPLAGQLNEERVGQLAEEIHALLESGRKVVLVSSGAVGAGIGRLGLSGRPADLAQLQAVAAVGQCRLIETYDRVFSRHRRHAAQLLLTAEDLDHRTRYLNVRNTLLALMEFGAVPIINENDTVAVEELQTTFGDNDHLAALVTNLICAPLLVVLSDVEGLFDRDPSDPAAQVISTVPKLEESTWSLVRDKQTGLSKGGMASKLNAARIVTSAGENVIIASGRNPHVLAEIFAGRPIGTLFLAQGRNLPSWKRWIGFTVQPRGHLVLDDGAQRAIAQQGRSLLAIGVREVAGGFRKGDVVSLHGPAGTEIARGLINYDAAEMAKIKGLRTDQIDAPLGHCPYEEVVQRDNLVLMHGG